MKVRTRYSVETWNVFGIHSGVNQALNTGAGSVYRPHVTEAACIASFTCLLSPENQTAVLLLRAEQWRLEDSLRSFGQQKHIPSRMTFEKGHSG